MPLRVITGSEKGKEWVVYCKVHKLYGHGITYEKAKCNVKKKIFKKGIKIPDGIEECY